MCNHVVAMHVTRSIELDAPLGEVWQLLSNTDELAGWVGEEVRGARVDEVDPGRKLRWTWAPGGRESSVEVTLVEAEGRTVVHVVERASSFTSSSAMACARCRWADALFCLELSCLCRLTLTAR